MIGFDAKRAAQNRTGLGNYSRFVIEALSRRLPQTKLALYVPDPGRQSALRGVDKLPNVLLRYPACAMHRMLRSLWRVWGVTGSLHSDGVALFHGLSNELPLNISKAQNVRSVVTIHDLIFRRYPEYYKFIDRKIYDYKFRKACVNADRVIAVSECTKRDIVHFYGIEPEKIDVVYQGCDASFREPVDESLKDEVRAAYLLPQRFILTVGTIESRKNAMLLARALQFLPEDVHVVAIGRRTKYADAIDDFLDKNNLRSRFRMLCNVPFAHLPAFYHLAQVMAYPSRFEGFGIPILEALCCGTPVVAATGSCLEEAGGKGSIYVDPDSPQQLADAVMRVLTDESLRLDMIERGLQYSKRFLPEALADELVEVYNKLIVM